MIFDVPSLSQMISNLDKQVPQFIGLFTAISYMLGLIMMFSAVYKFRHHAETRGGGNSEIKTPIVLLIFGGLLLFFPSIVHTGIDTLWHYSSPLAYLADPNGDDNDRMVKSLVHLVQAVGVISAIRGLSLLSKAGTQGGAPNITGKGITHLVAGIIAVNIYGMWSTLEASLGFGIH